MQAWFRWFDGAEVHGIDKELWHRWVAQNLRELQKKDETRRLRWSIFNMLPMEDASGDERTTTMPPPTLPREETTGTGSGTPGNKSRREFDVSPLARGFRTHSMDLIIDDGPHDVFSQQIFLEKMWPILKPGGTYVIEDIFNARMLECPKPKKTTRKQTKFF